MTVELVAIGQEPRHRAKTTIAPGVPLCLGRSPRAGFKVGWDSQLSREHAELCWDGTTLVVRCLPTARNPLMRGKVHSRELQLSVGDSFQIGNTEFRVEAAPTDSEAGAGPSVLSERSFAQEDLSQVKFGNSDQRMEILARLPKLIAASKTDDEFPAALAGLLLQALPRANAAAVVVSSDAVSSDVGASGLAEPEIMCCDTRDSHVGDFRPSRRLVQKALSEGNSRLHIFKTSEESASEYTVSANLDWAFCTPVLAEACAGWCLYVSGKSPSGALLRSEDELKDDVRFVELLAQFVGATCQVLSLKQQQAGLSQFFSPAVMETLTGSKAESLLEPRECDITTLFCDVRGFSRKAEKAQHSLHELLGRVSHALGVMTRGIVRHDGIIADFQGDAALGFWGWPIAPEEGPVAACRAALDIHAEFRRAVETEGHVLADFQVGIGVSHGRAIAGKIGSAEQAKVGVFGPVVNLGSRLEDLTKHFRASILLDEATAEFARAHLPPSEGRFRRLARLQPYGMETVVTVTELLPPAGDDLDISDEQIATYESALQHVIDGDWARALDLLSELPVRDRAKDFLMIMLAQHNYEAPEDWNGTISMTHK